MIKYKGKEYNSLHHLCNKLNLNYKAINTRMNRTGISLDEAVDFAMQDRTVKYNGKTYNSINHLCTELNLVPDSLYYRMNKLGMSLDDAIEYERDYKSIAYKGVNYNSVREFADKHNYDYGKIADCIRRTKSIEDAIHLYSSITERIELWGKKYSKLTDIADNFGIERAYFNNIYYNMNDRMDLAQMVTFAMKEKGVTFDGKQYNTITDLCREYNILPANLFNRIYSGWGMAEALSTQVVRRPTNTPVNFRGKEYFSKLALIDECSIADSLVRKFSRDRKIEWIHSLEILADYFDKLGGDRPVYISYIPYIIYNNVWYRDSREFCEQCNIDRLVFSRFKSKLKIENSFDVVKYLINKTETKYEFNGNIYGHAELASLGFGMVDKLIRHGVARKVSVKVYPDIKFEPKGYCLDSNLAFKKYLDSIGCK